MATIWSWFLNFALASTCWGQTRVHWTQVDGILKQISAGPAGVFGVNHAGVIFYRHGTRGFESSRGSGWLQLDGLLTQLDVGTNLVVGVTVAGDIFKRTGISSSTPAGTGWQLIGGKLKHVSVSNRGFLWGVNDGDEIFYCRVASCSWTLVDGRLKQISVGKAGVWGVNSHDQIWYRSGTFGDNGGPGNGWQQVEGGLKYVTSGDDVVMGINSASQIFRREGISSTTPTGTHWVQIEGSLEVIDAFSRSHFWGVNSHGMIFHGVA